MILHGLVYSAMCQENGLEKLAFLFIHLRKNLKFIVCIDNVSCQYHVGHKHVGYQTHL